MHTLGALWHKAFSTIIAKHIIVVVVREHYIILDHDVRMYVQCMYYCDNMDKKLNLLLPQMTICQLSFGYICIMMVPICDAIGLVY